MLPTTKSNNFIKIPTDFQSLSDMKDLGQYYRSAVSFIEVIKEYQYRYLDSMIMTFGEVMSFIPEKQLSLYNVYLFENKLVSLSKFRLDQLVLKNECINHIYKLRTLYSNYSQTRNIQPDEKIFLIDTKNKKIQVCLWNLRFNANVQGFHFGYECNLEFSQKIQFQNFRQ